MPYRMEHEPGGTYRVVNTETGDVKGSGMTMEDAQAQMRLLHGIEHGMEPGAMRALAGAQLRRLDVPDG